jgi:hypothetical protein
MGRDVEGSDLGVIWVIIENLSGGTVHNCGQYVTVDSRTWRRGKKGIAVWFWTAERRYVCPWANAAYVWLSVRDMAHHRWRKKIVSSVLRIEALWDSELWKPQIPQFRLSFPLSPSMWLFHSPLPLPYLTPLNINIVASPIFVRSLSLSYIYIFPSFQPCSWSIRTVSSPDVVVFSVPQYRRGPFPPLWQKRTLIYNNYCMSDYVCMYVCVSNVNLSLKKADFVRLKGPEDAKQNERRSTTATAVLVQLWSTN